MFSLKQFVMCIDDSIDKPEVYAVFQEWIVKGIVYQIRYIFDNDGIVTGLLLYGVQNRVVFIPALKREQEPAFATWRFRALTSEEQSQVDEMVGEANRKMKKIKEGELIDDYQLIEN